MSRCGVASIGDPQRAKPEGVGNPATATGESGEVELTVDAGWDDAKKRLGCAKEDVCDG